MPHPTYRYEKWASANLDIRLGAGSEEQYARCPFTANHKNGDQRPSFGINVRTGLYICHGCGERGNFRKLAKELRVSLVETPPDIDDLLDRVNAAIGQSVEEDKVQVYTEKWLRQFDVDERAKLDFWHRQRRIPVGVIEDFSLGIDPLRRAATIPLRDFHGRVLGVVRRQLRKGVNPRYLYPKAFKISEHLWGAHYCRGEEVVALCEGSIDALACWGSGIPAVAILGSHISPMQVQLLHKIGPREVVMMPDRNAPGRKAVEQVREAVQGIAFSVGHYHRSWKGRDPADLTHAQRVVMYQQAR